MDPVGYLINRNDGPDGKPGIGYDYLLARNGLYVQARNPHLEAQVLITPTRVRGLSAATEHLSLPHGRIPKELFEIGLRWFQETPHTERFFALRWDNNAYRLTAPDQTGSPTGLRYRPQPGMIAEFHSHGNLDAFFSRTDDQDEQGFRIYGVAGKLATPRPELRLRIGVYGHFSPLEWEQVFQGPTPGIFMARQDPD